jgi:hypothetical protein
MSDSTRRARGLDAAIRLFNRNPWSSRRLEISQKPDEADPPLYGEDGLSTRNAHAFTDEARFRRAYQRAVRAGGWDYGIRWRAHVLLWAAEMSAHRDGAFVECGTGRGFMMSAVCEYLGWGDRPLYLFDTFKPTLPDEAGAQAPDGAVSTVYASDPNAVEQTFAEWPAVELVVGEIPASFAQVRIDAVAFVHVDLNHPVPEEASVRHFWPRLASGGAMIFDDYGFPGREAQREVHDRLARELDFSILALPTGQGLVIKSPTS